VVRGHAYQRLHAPSWRRTGLERPSAQSSRRFGAADEYRALEIVHFPRPARFGRSWPSGGAPHQPIAHCEGARAARERSQPPCAAEYGPAAAFSAPPESAGHGHAGGERQRRQFDAPLSTLLGNGQSAAGAAGQRSMPHCPPARRPASPRPAADCAHGVDAACHLSRSLLRSGAYRRTSTLDGWQPSSVLSRC
jgi:hypothetical protein